MGLGLKSWIVRGGMWENCMAMGGSLGVEWSYLGVRCGDMGACFLKRKDG
jgi:hypothetical protein